MKLIVNGQPVTTELSGLEQVLVELGHDDKYIATAVNEVFIPRQARADTVLKDGDRIEILAPRQGG